MKDRPPVCEALLPTTRIPARKLDNVSISSIKFYLLQPQFRENKVPSSMHQIENCGTDALIASFPNESGSKKSVVEIEAKFHTFWPRVKIRGGWDKMLNGDIEYTLRPNLLCTFNGRQLRGVEV